MKKLLALAMASVMAFSLAACGSGAPAAETTPAAESTAETTESTETAADTAAAATEGEGLKIAIVSSPSGVDDGSFNEDN